MIFCCVEPTLWKQTLIFLVRFSLNLGYCLMVMLGGMLVANKSYAQTCDTTNVFPGVPVVVQNVTLYVRETPEVKQDNHLIVDGEKLRVYDADEGRVMLDKNRQHMDKDEQYSSRDGKYVWYYVKWDRFPEAGWSAGIRDEEAKDKDQTAKWIATILEANQKDAIVEALFNGTICCEETQYGYITHDETGHDYNDYRCNAYWGKDHWYPDEGHAGWDVYANVGVGAPFYSLTTGKILFSRPQFSREEIEDDSNHTIAIFDGEKTTLYLHARDVLVKPDENDMVYVGECLGTQGDTGIGEIGVHVHIEVQEGASMEPSWKDNDNEVHGNDTVNPIPYLYKWVVDRSANSTPSENGDIIGKGGGSPNPIEVQRDLNDDRKVNFLDQLRTCFKSHLIRFRIK